MCKSHWILHPLLNSITGSWWPVLQSKCVLHFFTVEWVIPRLSCFLFVCLRQFDFRYVAERDFAMLYIFIKSPLVCNFFLMLQKKQSNFSEFICHLYFQQPFHIVIGGAVTVKWYYFIFLATISQKRSKPVINLSY